MNLLFTLAPALVTPFHESGEIDFDALDTMIEHVISGGVDAIVVLGTTGESSTLSPAERLQIFEHVSSKVAKRVKLIAGIGGNNTAEIAELCEEFPFSKSYSAILSVCPYYTKPTQTGIYAHFRTIAERSVLPIILYNVPSRTGVNMDSDTIISLSHDCPNILGIKEASGNLEQVEIVVENAREGFQVYSGDDLLSHEIIGLGGVGCIGVLPNAFPSEFKRYIDASLSGDISSVEESLEMLQKYHPLMYEEGNPVGIKALLSYKKLCQNTVRLPLVSASDSLQKRISSI